MGNSKGRGKGEVRGVLTAIMVLIIMVLSLETQASNKGETIFYPLTKLHPQKKEERPQTITPTPKKTTPPKLFLSAVVISKNKLALINGKLLKEGDTINGCILKNITEYPPTVLLNCNGTNLKLRINIIKEEIK